MLSSVLVTVCKGVRNAYAYRLLDHTCRLRSFYVRFFLPLPLFPLVRCFDCRQAATQLEQLITACVGFRLYTSRQLTPSIPDDRLVKRTDNTSFVEAAGHADHHTLPEWLRVADEHKPSVILRIS